MPAFDWDAEASLSRLHSAAAQLNPALQGLGEK